jgi:hypothetical protein
VCQSLSETTVCTQTFIVKTLIISNTDNCPIYIKRKEGERGLAAGETERVCERHREWLKTEVASVVKMAVGGTDHLG